MVRAKYKWGIVALVLALVGGVGWVFWPRQAAQTAMTQWREPSFTFHIVNDFHLGFSYSIESRLESWLAALSEEHNRLVAFDPSRFKWLVYDLSGTLLHSFGEAGSESGQHLLPSGVTFNSKGEIGVADYQQEQIGWFTQEGELATETPAVRSVGGWADVAITRDDVIIASPSYLDAFRGEQNGLYLFSGDDTTMITQRTTGILATGPDDSIYVIKEDGAHEVGQAFIPTYYLDKYSLKGERLFSRELPTEYAKMSIAYWPKIDRVVLVDGGSVQLLTPDGQFMETLFHADGPETTVAAALAGQDLLWLVFMNGTVQAVSVTPVSP